MSGSNQRDMVETLSSWKRAQLIAQNAVKEFKKGYERGHQESQARQLARHQERQERREVQKSSEEHSLLSNSANQYGGMTNGR